jgi:hypothetical protein
MPQGIPSTIKINKIKNNKPVVETLKLLKNCFSPYPSLVGEISLLLHS